MSLADTTELRPRAPRSAFVVSLLALAAATFSYLGAYAIPQALVAQNILHAWSPGHDPRPRWVCMSFATLIVLFTSLAAAWRFLSRRQLKGIDAMAGDEVES